MLRLIEMTLPLHHAPKALPAAICKRLREAVFRMAAGYVHAMVIVAPAGIGVLRIIVKADGWSVSIYRLYCKLS